MADGYSVLSTFTLGLVFGLQNIQIIYLRYRY
jgi:hypothetical protein